MGLTTLEELNSDFKKEVLDEKLKQINETIKNQYKENVLGKGDKFVLVNPGELKEEITDELTKAGYTVEDSDNFPNALKVSW